MYCRRCGAALHQGVVICPECGARQRRGFSAIRCARCGDPVPLGLTVCPRCGRDVHAAGPRWGLWISGFAVVALAMLWGLGELPVESIVDKVASIRSRIEGVVQVLGPVSSDLAESGKDLATPQVVAELDEKPSPTSVRQVVAEELATEDQRLLADLPGPGATEQVTESPTSEPSPTLEPMATSTPMPTNTPTPEPTATATTLPTATPTAVPTQKPAPTGSTTYTVKPGDNLSSIGAKFGIAWQELAAANKLPNGARLRIGQVLVIPAVGGAVAAPPTATPRATPTLTPTEAPLQPSPTPVQLLSAPQLLSPGDQTPFSGGNANLELVWASVDGMPFDADYQISIRWVEQGAPMEYSDLYTNATSIRMPGWLFGKADQPARQYSWSVRVVTTTTDGQGGRKNILLSPSSVTRVFYWN